ncbi:hypothetical protein WA026_017899 [Henosepilachna vigintioctopunctata]|uniref:Uncharacterized protein n=1 Tax=Henosepilachna vigintioctopunctata TaxID=420089 RepID=A0AAW1TLY3_9CUCU
MNSIAALFFFAVVAVASASLIGPSGIISRSYVAPALSPYSALPYAYGASPYVAPYVAPYASHVSAYSSHVAAPVVSAYSAPLAYGYHGHAAENTVVAGPSGTISSSKSVAAPAYAAGYAARYAAYPYSGLYW